MDLNLLWFKITKLNSNSSTTRSIRTVFTKIFRIAEQINTRFIKPVINFGKNKAKESHKIPAILFVLLFIALLIAALSSFPIRNANATFSQSGDFQMALTVEHNFYYTEDTIKIGMRLQNVSKQIQLVKFNGGCQATYQIYNLNDELVFPRFAEETPCNNDSYEEFLIASNQAKRYFFEIKNIEPFKAPILPAGKYKIIGLFQGFGNTDPVIIEIQNKPDFSAKEGEFCAGLTGLSCSKDLVCKHEGGFIDGAGICMKKEGSFEPKNSCLNGVENCLLDVKNHYAKDVIEKFVLYNRISGFEDKTFKPDDFITVADFTKLVSLVSTDRVVIETTDPFVQRDTAIAILYKAFISKSAPRNLSRSNFIDIENSEYKEYIIKANTLGLIQSSTNFNPTSYLTRAEALILIDRFENY